MQGTVVEIQSFAGFVGTSGARFLFHVGAKVRREFQSCKEWKLLFFPVA